MGIDEFLDFMPNTVTLNAWVSNSVSGVPTYNPTGITYPCRIEIKNRLIVDAKGREVLARGRVFLGTATVPGILDKITLPAEYIPVSPPIVAVDVQDDENGGHHVTLFIG